MKRKLFFLFVLSVVSLVALSSVTYAGFSKQYNPKVDNLQFSVATQENMMISTTGNPGTFKDNISFSELVPSSSSVVLKPVKGQVMENSISLLEGENPANVNNYLKFTLYFSGSNDMDIYLAGSTSGTVIDTIEVENGIFTQDDIKKMVESLRIGFLSYSTREIPTGSGIEISYTPLTANVYSFSEKTDESYVNGLTYDTFTELGDTGGVEDDVVLLETTANKVSKMDIYIWLESEDVNCDIDIFNAILRINLRFLAVNVESGGVND